MRQNHSDMALVLVLELVLERPSQPRKRRAASVRPFEYEFEFGDKSDMVKRCAGYYMNVPRISIG
jgi:hypothetical protein